MESELGDFERINYWLICISASDIGWSLSPPIVWVAWCSVPKRHIIFNQGTTAYENCGCTLSYTRGASFKRTTTHNEAIIRLIQLTLKKPKWYYRICLDVFLKFAKKIILFLKQERVLFFQKVRSGAAELSLVMGEK